MAPFRRADSVRLTGAENLTALNLRSNSGITTKGLGGEATLTQLRELFLPPHTTDDDLAQLAPLKQLTELNLDGTQVTSRGIVALAQIESLKDLPLQNVSLTDAAVPTPGIRLMRSLLTSDDNFAKMPARIIAFILRGGTMTTLLSDAVLRLGFPFPFFLE